MISTRVLLVEDDAFLKEIYHDTLTQAGFEVSTATNGTEALEKIKQGDWNVLLMDIILPQMDGIEVLKTLKADNAYESLFQKPIIFLTNLDNENEKNQALELGHDYLVKSQISPGDLVSHIQDVLKSSSEV